jgi:hypothetical protein
MAQIVHTNTVLLNYYLEGTKMDEIRSAGDGFDEREEFLIEEDQLDAYALGLQYAQDGRL